MKGKNKLTKKEREFLINLVGECEICSSKEDLQVHRIIRGNKGGKYNPRNCEILCGKHHKMLHSGEFK